jgi:uncharacterized membrane protein YuzA (DUF378 family)
MVRQAAAPVGLAVAAAVVALATGGSTAGTAIAIALVGVAAVVALSLVFYAIGKSEDEERAKARSFPSSAAPPSGGADRNGPNSRAPQDDHGANGRVSEARRRRRPLPPRRPE